MSGSAPAAAFWLVLCPEVDMRRTDYDVPAALDAMRATGAPDLDEVGLRESLVDPIDAAAVAQIFEERAASA